MKESEFFGLFVKCERCGLITTRQVFKFHLEECVDKDQTAGDAATDVASESDEEP